MVPSGSINNVYCHAVVVVKKKQEKGEGRRENSPFSFLLFFSKA